MGTIKSLRSSEHTRRTLAYVLAVILPILGTILDGKIPQLKAFPFAPYFIGMALVSTLGGIWPTMLGLCVTLLFYSGIVGRGIKPSEIATPDRFRYVFLSTCSLIVGIISQRRLISEKKLAIAVDELRDRTDALVDSLHTSKCASWTLDDSVQPSFRWYSGSFPIFGRHYSEVPDLSSLIPFIHPDDQQRLSDLERDLRFMLEPIAFDFRCIWPNGDVHRLEMRGTRLPGRAPRWRGVTLDITERHHAEAAIRTPERAAVMNYPATSAPRADNLVAAEAELVRLGNLTGARHS